MKILITGSNGQLGSELKKLLPTDQHEILFTDYQDLDITKLEGVKIFFEKEKPDYCINCAAYTAVDKAESDVEMAKAINETGAENLAIASKAFNSTLIHVSTDFVFDGSQNVPVKEDEPAAPVSVYGQTKLDGELKIAENLDQYFILRTSWLYSTFANNFVKTMLKLSESKDKLTIISDQTGTPTYAEDLAKVIIKIIEDKNENYGLYHYSNEGTATWYDFAVAIFEYAGKDFPVLPIRTWEYPTPAERPAYSVMDKSKIKTALGVSIPHWRTSLKNCMAALGY